jgi:hypothetical protein
MKKVYIKPDMRVYKMANSINLLTGSVKGVYGKIDGNEQNLKYGGVVLEEEEEDIDPD